MNILVIGSGGREHAICSAFSRSRRVTRLFCANGNAGIASLAECVAIRPEEIERLADFAKGNDIDLTFVGGESALAMGIVDLFETEGLRIIGPSKAAARLEASTAFSKDFMARHGVPTAAYRLANSPGDAEAALSTGVFGAEDAPVVVKADGLAAGKGVVVARDRGEALAAIRELSNIAGAEAASKIVLEECLEGKEVSLIMFADGEDFALMPPTRDHKRIGEGDTGPNTGGMGTITDDSLLTEEQREAIVNEVIRPTLRGCVEEGLPFRGILFLGLMMTSNGAKVLEYNVRFGDPETQSILVRLESDLIDICDAMLDGRLSDIDINWRRGNSATVVLAAEGYPQSPRKGDVIRGVDEAAADQAVAIFHAGTARSESGELITAGGRVLGVTAIGETLDEALRRSYSAVSKIGWDGMQYRRDIGK
jgi:phosphoribosylamine---glycine ligase